MKFPTQLLWGLFHKPKIKCPRKWTLRISRVMALNYFRKIPPINFASLKHRRVPFFFRCFFRAKKLHCEFCVKICFIFVCNSHLRIFQGPFISFRLQHASPPQKIPKPEQLNLSRLMLKVGLTNPQRPPSRRAKGEGTKLVMTSLGHHHLHKGANRSRLVGWCWTLGDLHEKTDGRVWSSGCMWMNMAWNWCFLLDPKKIARWWQLKYFLFSPLPGEDFRFD